tara:strand:+ start:345 stop:554 length:210 start_codon:yes stop_codon:yes gene_type:complete
MKEIITDALKEMCLSSQTKMDTESGRDNIADKLLEVFESKHIVFYTNLEKHREDEEKEKQMNIPFERGL